MRSEYRFWSDVVERSWRVRAGTGRVLYQWAGGQRVQNDNGSWTPREFTYVETPDDSTLPMVVMECEYGDDLVPRVMAVQVVQRDSQREVRSVDLRQLRLEDALEQAWTHATRRPAVVTADSQAPASAAPLDRRKTFRGLRSQNRRKITKSLHHQVAEIYQAALPTGAPTKAVAEHFGLAPSTAHLYVKRAREAGVLPPRPAERDHGTDRHPPND